MVGLTSSYFVLVILMILQISNTTAEYTCTKKGRFADPWDTDCKKYYLCSKLYNGTFLATPYSCPATSNFDQSIGKCSALYSCAITSTTTTTTTTIPTTKLTTELDFTTIIYSTPHVTTEWQTTTPQFSFECKEKGRFPDVSDKTCRNYFLCSKLNNGTLIKTPYSCPNSWFDPDSERCSSSYICASDPPTTTTQATTVHYDFICSKVGRFPDRNDNACVWYWLCNKLRNGTFIQTAYKCPSTAVFDSLIHICNTQRPCGYEFVLN